jgi:hypothetical protein
MGWRTPGGIDWFLQKKEARKGVIIFFAPAEGAMLDIPRGSPKTIRFFLATRLYHQTIQFGKPGPPLLLSFA